MRTLSLLLSLTLIGYTAQAQSYAGTYASGATTLTIAEDEYGDFVGVFVDDPGGRYEVELEKDGQELSGFFWNEATEFAAGAALDGNRLVLYLIPFDGDGEPNADAAKEYVLDRRGGPAPTRPGPPANQAPPPSLSPDPPMAPAQPPAFAGTYAGALNGVPTTLTIQQQDATLHGQADAGGYRYTIAATAAGSTARGRLDDPATGGSIDLELSLQGDQLTVTLFVPDAAGQVQRTPAYFQRGAASAAGPAPGARAADDANVERDSALIGLWAYTESMTSGDASMVTQVFLQVNPDGSYAYGNGRAVGGGAGWSGDTGGGDDVTRGTWRTQDRIVYIREAGSPQWVPYARYYVEGARMMFTLGDGSRQVWHRR